jgi:hypothetical protein
MARKVLTRIVFAAAMLITPAVACPVPLVGAEFHGYPWWNDWSQQWEYLFVPGEYGRDYQYLMLPPDASPGSGWQSSSFDHSDWQTGESAFSNSTEVDGAETRTAWEANTDLFLFKTFWKKTWVPSQTLKAKITVADAYEFYLNGVLVSSASGDEFVTHWEYVEVIPSSRFQLGTNEIGIVAKSRGSNSAFDFVLWSIPEAGSGWLVFTGAGALALFRAYTISSRRGSHFTLRSWR